MRSAKAQASKSILQNLPSVDEMLQTEIAKEIEDGAGAGIAASLVRAVIGQLRTELQETPGNEAAGGKRAPSADDLKATAQELLALHWQADQLEKFRRVINATGVIIHTNLGRAPLSEKARQAVSDQAAGYCTVEYDIRTGKRGRRGGRAEKLLCELTGAEDALIVNNGAAAAFFVLTVFAAGGEVVISRGELVEIGGDFRVPDVLSQSRAKLREVGTTNRTKLVDYEKAFTTKTKMILRVHPSNYRIIGFTAAPTVRELAELAHRHELLFYEDLGSGALVDLSSTGLGGEPIVRDSIIAGADVVTFSGDKLLGGPQAGIIAGKAAVIGRLRKHPLYRALRADKLVYAALEATLGSYRRGTEFTEIPVLRMLAMTAQTINERAERFETALKKKLRKGSGLQVRIIDGESAVGGGAAPGFEPKTRLLSLSHQTLTSSVLEEKLRRSDPPVIARIVGGQILIDLRTVAES